MRKELLIAAMIAAISVGMFGGAASGSVDLLCPSTTPSVVLAQGPNPGAVNPNSSVAFRLSVPSGSVGEIVVTHTGDTDMIICRAGTTTVACKSTNAAGVPDACADEGLEGPQGFGPNLTAGSYWGRLIHCTDAECGYEADVPAPIAYSINFALV